MAMRVGVHEIPPLISSSGSDVKVAVPLDSTSSDADVLVDRVIRPVNGDAPEFTLSNTCHDVTTFAHIGTHLKTLGIILGVAGEALELSWEGI